MGTDPFVTCSDTVALTGATLDLPAGKGISCCVGSTKPPAVLAHGDYSTLVLIHLSMGRFPNPCMCGAPQSMAEFGVPWQESPRHPAVTTPRHLDG